MMQTKDTMIGKAFHKKAKNGKMIRLEVWDEEKFSSSNTLYFLKNKKGKVFQVSGSQLLKAMNEKILIPCE